MRRLPDCFKIPLNPPLEKGDFDEEIELQIVSI
jgi:hypothetical protein